MAKHAYLIMVHNHAALVNELLTLLDDSRNDIFLHVDLKANDDFVAALNRNLRFSSIYFSNRVRVSWGGFSQIQAEMSLLKQATDTDHYDYYHLISGADLPIKSQNQIHQFFESIQGLELVQFQQPQIDKQKLDRVQRYFPFQEHDIRHSYFLSLIQRTLAKVQRILNVDRTKNSGVKFQMGSNWFSITDDFARYILAQFPRYEKYFQYTQCADELFVQTMLINSPFRKRLYHPKFDDSTYGNMRFIVWVNHAPRDLVIDDFESLKSSPLLFAWKFNPDTDNQIIGKVANELAK